MCDSVGIYRDTVSACFLLSYFAMFGTFLGVNIRVMVNSLSTLDYIHFDQVISLSQSRSSAPSVINASRAAGMCLFDISFVCFHKNLGNKAPSYRVVWSCWLVQYFRMQQPWNNEKMMISLSDLLTVITTLLPLNSLSCRGGGGKTLTETYCKSQK